MNHMPAVRNSSSMEIANGAGNLLEGLASRPVIGPGTRAYKYCRANMAENERLLKDVYARADGGLVLKHGDLPGLCVAALVDPRIAASLRGSSVECEIALAPSWDELLRLHPLWCPAYVRFFRSFKGADLLLEPCGSDTLDRLIRLKRDPVRAVVLGLLRRDDAKEAIRSYAAGVASIPVKDHVYEAVKGYDSYAVTEVGRCLAARSLLFAVLKLPGAGELVASALQDADATVGDMLGDTSIARECRRLLFRSGQCLAMWGLVHAMLDLGCAWSDLLCGGIEESQPGELQLPADLSIPGFGGEAFAEVCRDKCAEVADWYRSEAKTIMMASAGAEERTEPIPCAPADSSKDVLGRKPPAEACPPMGEVTAGIRAIARRDCAVLLTGEPGTGKGFWARKTHDLSKRCGDFVPVLCPTIPKDLFESELFGHRKGAFTGADGDKQGLVEAAADGTLFLDEIAELPTRVQAKLLYLLQEGTFRRVGETKERKARCRIVLATNQDLAALVKSGAFREDLLARMGTFAFHLPPLRERRDEIPGLVRAFQEELSPKRTRRVSPKECEKLRHADYHWPGNVRALRSAVERAFVLSRKRYVSAATIIQEARKLVSAADSRLALGPRPLLSARPALSA
ncbi:MAG: sigma 54-interacting transcriptional regulator [Planctomycetota bacterium]|jgi:transcriptional regulator with AAA-type ATPase domain